MKKLLAIILSLVMVLSMTTVSWAEGTTPVVAHSHDSEWEDLNNYYVTADDVYSGGSLSGNYYLSGDLKLDSTMIIANETTICLNGYVLEGPDNNSVITVNRRKSLTICSCATSIYGYVADDSTGLWTLTKNPGDGTFTSGGVITGGNATGTGNSIDQGNTTNRGGGIAADNGAIVTLSNISIVGNKATGEGGGIYCTGSANSQLIMTDTKVMGNTAGDFGGGISTRNKAMPNTTLTNCDIIGNVSQSKGGGGYLMGKATLTNVTVSDNKANSAAGLNLQQSTAGDMTLTGCTFTRNVATGGGGGLNVAAVSVKLFDCDIINNTSGSDGAGLASENGSAIVTMDAQTNVTGNTTNGKSSDVFVLSGTNDLAGTMGSLVVSNKANKPVTVDGPITGDVTLSGQVEMTINGDVTGNITATRGTVTIGENATVTGNLTVTGGNTTVNGTVDSMTVTKGTATVNGTVTSGVTVSGGTTTIAETATVTNGVTVTGGNLTNNNPSVKVEVDTENMTNGSAVDKDKVLVAKSDTNAATLEAAKMSQATTMNVTVNGVNLVFDGDSTTMVKGSANGADVTVTVEELADQTALTNEQQEQLKNREVKGIYNITLTANGTPATEITNFSAGKLIVTIPYEKTEGKNVKFYCVTDTGMESIPTKYQDGELIATLSHLSTYAIVEYTPSSGGYVPSGHYVTSPFTGVDKVYVDGALVDAKNYTTSGGNVTLLQSYLDGLKGGNHTIKIVYGSRQATGTFTTKGTGVVQSAKTFDAGIALYAGMALMSAAGAVYVTKKR